MFYTDDFIADVLKVEEWPEHLYRYLSIETLALTLQSCSLRFARLDTVNDPTEASARDIDGASQLVFASCWTEEDRESIAMWQLYTPDMQGVRIRLPTNPFPGRNPPMVMDKGGARQIFDGDWVTINRRGEAPSWSVRILEGPNKVFYTDDEEFLSPQCLERDETGTYVCLHDLGMAKNKHWAFEREWRYMLRAIAPEMVHEDIEWLDDVLLNLEDYPVLDVGITVPLDPGVLDELEVLMGPRATPAQRVIVDALLQRYAPRAVLSHSEIPVR